MTARLDTPRLDPARAAEVAERWLANFEIGRAHV